LSTEINRVSLTSILSGIEERELGLVTNRIEQLVRSIGGAGKHLGEVAHVVSRKNEAASNPRSPDILFDIGLAIKVRNVGEASVGLLLHMVERRENKVGNAHGLGNIGDILALGVFNIGVHSLPVVCDQEDSVRTLEGCG
jgi:hypothetical protein